MRRRMITSMIVVGALALGACGGDDDDTTTNDQSSESTTTQAASSSSDVAASDDTALAGDDFDGVPLPEGAELVGEPLERSDFVVETYTVDVDPEDVLAFYAAQLADDDRAETGYAPRDAGGGTWRGMWVVDGRQLLVAAEPGDDGTELRLTLRDAA